MSEDIKVESVKDEVAKELEVQKPDDASQTKCVNGLEKQPNAFSVPRKLVDYSSESGSSSADSESDSADSVPKKK